MLWWSYRRPWPRLLVNGWCDWPLMCHMTQSFGGFQHVAEQTCMITARIHTHTQWIWILCSCCGTMTSPPPPHWWDLSWSFSAELMCPSQGSSPGFPPFRSTSVGSWWHVVFGAQTEPICWNWHQSQSEQSLSKLWVWLCSLLKQTDKWEERMERELLSDRSLQWNHLLGSLYRPVIKNKSSIKWKPCYGEWVGARRMTSKTS